MSRSFSYPSARLHELVKMPKCPVPNADRKWKERGTQGRELKLTLDSIDGPYVRFVLYANCGDLADPTTYRAALTLDGERIRGVDFSEIERQRFYKKHLQKGWHENIIDPNLPGSDLNRNRHVPLPEFQPIDLESFLRQVCQMWQIELDFEENLL